MLRPLLVLAIPAWSVVALALVRVGGCGLAWSATLLVALALATWAGARVGTGNPVSRTARWDRWLAGLMAALLLAIPGAGITWSVVAAAPRSGWIALGAGLLGGLVALPLAFAVAIVVEVVWPH